MRLAKSHSAKANWPLSCGNSPSPCSSQRCRISSRIAAAAEDVAARLQLGLALGIVEQLAVEDHGDGAVLVEDRLLAVSEPDDAEPLLDGADAWCEQCAGLVGSAMGQRRAHARDLRPIRLPSTLEVDHTCQAAHEPSLDCFAAYVKRVQRSDRPSQPSAAT